MLVYNYRYISFHCFVSLSVCVRVCAHIRKLLICAFYSVNLVSLIVSGISLFCFVSSDWFGMASS